MKCLCFSDSHGSIEVMQSALRKHPDAEIVFFLGDGILDCDYVMASEPSRAWIRVAGNCDPVSVVLRENIKYTDFITVEGFKIALTHGHKYEVKFGLDNLVYFAEESEADIVLFGHTHTPCEKFVRLPSDRGVYLFNPGSAYDRGGNAPAYGIITVKNGDVLFSHCFIT